MDSNGGWGGGECRELYLNNNKIRRKKCIESKKKLKDIYMSKDVEHSGTNCKSPKLETAQTSTNSRMK